MKTYTIDGVTYIVHDGKLFCELEEDGADEPSLLEPEEELPEPKPRKKRAPNGDGKTGKQAAIISLLDEGKTASEIADETGFDMKYIATVKWRHKKDAEKTKSPEYFAGGGIRSSPATVEQRDIADDGFPFTIAEKTTIVGLYKLNIGYSEIAKKFKSNRGEIAVYIAHLIETGQLKERIERDEAASTEDDLTELD